MDQCTHEVRIEYWEGITKTCGRRPTGQSTKNWMDENGIVSVKSFAPYKLKRRLFAVLQFIGSEGL